MIEIRAKVDRSMTITVNNPTAIVKGHPTKRGAGVHSDKRLRRSTRRSRNNKAIGDY